MSLSWRAPNATPDSGFQAARSVPSASVADVGRLAVKAGEALGQQVGGGSVSAIPPEAGMMPHRGK